MAEDFRFGIDVEATVSNKEEAILALQQLKREMEEVSQGVPLPIKGSSIVSFSLVYNSNSCSNNSVGFCVG